MKRHIIILLLLPLLISGCFGVEEIKLMGIKDVTYQELKGGVLRLAITATVHNPNRCDVKISNADMNLMLNNQAIGKVTQVERVELLGRTQKDYKIQVGIEIKDVFANLLSLYRMLMNEPKNLHLSGTVQVKSFLYSKTIQVDRLSFQ
jgi:LEA14-like dessication related protein